MTGNLECDWCDVPAAELRIWPVTFDHICATCFAPVFGMGDYTDLPLSDRKPAPTYAALLAFVEEVRDCRPDVISGRRRDPQDDAPDMIDAEVLWTLQADATALVGKAVKP